MAYAHSANSDGQWHDLPAHLRGTAEMASRFGAAFGAGEAARIVGLWHDLGKFHPGFQQYLHDSTRDPSRRGHGPDHKAAGSQLARQLLGPLALLIKGHHGGLDSRTGFESWLAARQHDPDVEASLRLAREAMPEEVGRPPAVELPAYIRRDPLAAELFLRMLFSTLVDADFLDTERHFNAGKAGVRGPSLELDDLLERFEASRARFLTSRAHASGYAAEVARAREAIYADCLRAAEMAPGLFKLTVPTGGGKTLSGMAFALHHAVRHGLGRVVVAVPYITITEQTAGVYRSAFQDEERDDTPAVLEHHSAVAAEPDGEDEDVWRRLAAENWDAPVVVTTTVQLFESLFANKPSRARKLHRLARSVIILDEAQALPAHLLTPTLDVLRELVRHYGATVVLSTATQPAFDAIPTFHDVEGAEIVQAPGRWFELLRRVRYEFLDRPMTWGEVADLVREEPHVLAVVNTKKDAFALLDALDDPDALHLSTTLCGAHRRNVLEEIKRRLGAGEPCRVVSTQVVEAGVDLDFPIVLRAAGPLDSVIQAAGRCNREGLLGAEGGRVVVFRPAEGGVPPGAYRTAYGVAQAALARLDREEGRPDRPDVLTGYFRELFQSIDTDRERVQELRRAFDYPEVAHRYRLVDSDTESVAIGRYGSEEERRDVARWLDALRTPTRDGSVQRYLMRRLQPYLVSVRSPEAARYRRRGLLDEVVPGIGVWQGDYDPVRGLTGEGLNPDALVV